MHNPVVIRDGSLAFVGDIRLVRIESIRIVNLLIDDVHVNIGKNDGMQVAVYMSN